MPITSVRKYSMFILMALSITAPAAAQTARVEVRVVDPARAAVVSAPIVLIHEASATRQTAVTGADGTASLEGLRVGAHRLEVAASGFALDVRTITVGAAPQTVLVVLEIAGITQQVRVLGTVTTRTAEDPLPGELINRNARAGILGDQSLLTLPYSQTSLGSKTLELFDDASQPLANVLQNNPSIRSSTSSPMYSDFSMRGVNMNGNHMMLNGVPSLFSQFTTPPTHIIERIDITSGPNAAINGVAMSNNGTDSGATPAPGVINVVTKSAPDAPVLRYTQTFSGRNNFGEYFDLGRRFGASRQWGVRVNAELMDGGLSLPGAENDNKNVFVNVDRRGRRSATNVFAGYMDFRINGAQRWFTFSGRNGELPEAPRSRSNYDFPETTKWQRGHVLTINHVQQLTTTWSAFANVGSQNKSGYKYNSSAALRFDDTGTFVTANVGNGQNEATKNAYGQAGVRGSIQTGAIRHGVAVAVDTAWARYWNDTNNSPTGLIGGGLYNGILFRPAFYPLPAIRTTVPQWIETNVGFTATDIVTYRKVDVLLAASLKHESFNNQLTRQRINNNNVLPTYGVTYRFTPEVSAYAGHTESFARGSIVANDVRYINRGDTLPPVRTQQNEVGVKLQRFGMLSTMAYFDQTQQNLIDVPVSSTTFRRDADGRNRYKGVELSSVGQLAERWTVTTGVLYLNGEREKTNGGTNDGKFVNGVAKWSSTVGLQYAPVQSIGLVGRAVYNGDAFIDAGTGGGATKIPSFVAFDAGANYRVTVGAVPLILNAMVYNAANRDYWMGRGGSTTFGLSMPRTFMMSAQLDF